MTITIARAALWVSCIGSLMFFGLYLYKPAYQDILKWISEIGLPQINDFAKKLPDWWQAASGILTGAGAMIARRHHTVDNRLNGKRYWLAKIEKNGHLNRVEWGEIFIQNIHKHKKGPVQSVISGTTREATPKRQIPNMDFQAADILIGEQIDTKLYFEWTYVGGGGSGITRINYPRIPREGFWNSVFKRTKLELSGKFMPDDGDNGDVEYFEDAEAANSKYQQLRQQI